MAASISVELDVTGPVVEFGPVALLDGDLAVPVTVTGGVFVSGTVAGVVATLTDGVMVGDPWTGGASGAWVPVSVLTVDDVGNTTAASDTLWFPGGASPSAWTTTPVGAGRHRSSRLVAARVGGDASWR